MTTLFKERRAPDLTRSDVGVVEVGEWEQTTAVTEQFLDVSGAEQWPMGLVSASLFQEIGGQTMVSYRQWGNEESWRRFVRRPHASPVAVPHIAAPSAESVLYYVYRRRFRRDAPEPGCFVMVSVEFDGPDQERQKRWIDTVLDALDAAPHPPSGGISGHFHVSLDGTRVLNYAEWEDEQSHQRAMDETGEMTVIRGPKWQQVRDFKGVQKAGFKRYRLVHSLSIPD